MWSSTLMRSDSPSPTTASTSSPATELGAAPGEVVFIDDTPLVVDSANEFGWHAVLHTGDTSATIAIVRTLLA